MRCGSSRCARRTETSSGRRTASARSSRSPWPWSSAQAPRASRSSALAATATVAYLSEDLPDPSQLESLTFAQPTILYDRDGEVELGRFQTVARRVIAYDDVPRLVLDATTTAEDRTFWENAGFDPAGDPVRDRGERKRRK